MSKPAFGELYGYRSHPGLKLDSDRGGFVLALVGADAIRPG